MRKDEICIYHSPLTDPYKVIFLESSSEALTSRVYSEWHDREVWVLSKLLESTGEPREAITKIDRPKEKMILGVSDFSGMKKKGRK